MKLPITSPQCVDMGSLAVLAPITIRRAYQGARINSTTRERIRRAAVEMGLPPPPEPRSEGNAA